MNPKPLLYVEDDENDAFLVRLGFQRAGLEIPLEVVSDGQQAMDYLSGYGPYADRTTHPLPCLVLLDLNLPVVSGLEVLKWLRMKFDPQDLPVIIFSSSSHPQDQQQARQLGANDYLVKPMNMARLESVLENLKRKWLAGIGVELPR